MGVRSGKRRQLKPPSEYQVPTTFVRSRRANGEPKGGTGIDPKLTPCSLERDISFLQSPHSPVPPLKRPRQGTPGKSQARAGPRSTHCWHSAAPLIEPSSSQPPPSLQ